MRRRLFLLALKNKKKAAQNFKKISKAANKTYICLKAANNIFHSIKNH